MNPPAYFEKVRSAAWRRWNQLEEDPELAAPWRQLFLQVQSPRHVLSELLQNADDAGASHASVVIEGDDFVFRHDGEDFAEDHFASLCRFGYSNKRALHTIGFRGIGFKSTFSIGDQVRLCSPTLSVVFNKNRFTEPVWVEGHSPAPEGRTEVRVRIADGHRRAQLEKNLKEWLDSPASLLFFRNIRHLNIGEHELRWETRGEGPLADSHWMTLASEEDRSCLLLRSPVEEFPQEARDEIHMERMVGADDAPELPPCRVELVVGVQGRLFVVLPTGVETALPFACNAPFIQDPARLKIKDPDVSPTNRWLLQRAGELAASALTAWVSRNDLAVDQRCEAYSLVPPPEDDDATGLGAACERIVGNAMDEALETTRFLLGADGMVRRRGGCWAVPNALLEVWDADDVSGRFLPVEYSAFESRVATEHRRRLVSRKHIQELPRRSVFDVLKSSGLPRPRGNDRLLALWSYVADDIVRYSFNHDDDDLRIFPVAGNDALFAAQDVVRTGGRTATLRQEDKVFLSRYALIVDPSWLEYLAENRAAGDDKPPPALARQVDSADKILRKLRLDSASDTSRLIENIARAVFAQQPPLVDECVHLAHLAAALEAKVTDQFRFVTRDNALRRVGEHVVSDAAGQLERFAAEQWTRAHALHSAYEAYFAACTREQWDQWVDSERSGLGTFIPLQETTKSIVGRAKLFSAVIERGGDLNELRFHYKTDEFVLNDYDFAQHWDYWKKQAADEGDEFWGKLLERILRSSGGAYLKRAQAARFQHRATTGTLRAITQTALISGWVMKLRELPCLPDTRGAMRQPAELLRRTPQTEYLLEVEPFVRAEFDNEATRPLLRLLGVRDTPSGPDRILERLRALSQSSNPPVYEVEKWYHRLDQLLQRATSEQQQDIIRAFKNSALILDESENWCRSTEVFLAGDEEQVPGAAIIHPSFRQLALWPRLGVADRPTADLAIKWLQGLQTGSELSRDDIRRVRALLPRYPDRIWDDCGHWLSLSGKWVPVTDFKYGAFEPGPIADKYLFASIKDRSADFRALANDVRDRPPFSLLAELAGAVEQRLEGAVSHVGQPQTREWIQSLGQGLRRIVLEDVKEQEQTRVLGQRLSATQWQSARGLEVVPYVDGVPVGTNRAVDVLWEGHVLHVADGSAAKMANAIATELGRMFHLRAISDAMKFCYDRPASFVADYLAENFELEPEEQRSRRPSPDTTADAGLSGGAGGGGNGGQYRDPDEQPASELERQRLEASVTAMRARNGEAGSVEDGIERADSAGDDIDASESAPPDFEASAEDGSDRQIDDEGTGVEPETEDARRQRRQKSAGPSLMARFAVANGYVERSPEHYVHADGRSLVRIERSGFAWQLRSQSGEALQYFWPLDQCLEREPVEIAAEAWHMCERSPQAYSLVLADLDDAAVCISGTTLMRMRDAGEVDLRTASYRLVRRQNGEQRDGR